MIETVKKALLAGVGAAVVSKEKIEKSLDELVSQGKVSAADARTLAERIAQDGKREFENVSESISTKVKEAMSHSQAETLARLAALEERVRVLEAERSAQLAADKEP